MRGRRHLRGFTLSELLAVMALLAIIAALAAPSFTGMLAKRRVEGVTAELVTDLQYARSEAVQRNAPVHVIFGPGCYFIHTVNGGSCTATSFTSPLPLPPPAISVLLKTVQLDGGVEIVANGPPPASPLITNLSFEPLRGAATASGSVNVKNTAGSLQLSAVVSGVGRVRTCSPNGSVPGHSSDCNP